MATDNSKHIEARRAYRQQLRAVARLLRWSGIALVLLGTIGIALGHSGQWYVPPSWVSFIIGWALVLSGVVSRVRTTPVGSDE